MTLEPCPLGFKLRGGCVCDDILDGTINIDPTSLTCDIHDHTGYITREGTVWVGVNASKNNTDIYYWHRYCLTDYCLSFQTSIDLKSTDDQCNFCSMVAVLAVL